MVDVSHEGPPRCWTGGHGLHAGSLQDYGPRAQAGGWRLARDGCNSRDDGDAELIGERGAPATCPRLLGFLRSASWQKFRERWRTIDAVPSGDAARGSTNDPKVQEAGRLALEALDELEKDPLAEGIEPGTFQALKFVVSNRIAVLSGLEFRLMVAHMMPSGSDMARARAGASLEQRIDALIELRKKGALTPEERDLALRGITNRIHLLVVLQSMHGYFMSDPLERAESLEDLQRVLEARRASDSGAKDLVEQLEKGLAEARSMAPVLDAMVADLER